MTVITPLHSQPGSFRSFLRRVTGANRTKRTSSSASASLTRSNSLRNRKSAKKINRYSTHRSFNSSKWVSEQTPLADDPPWY
ncbi:hypothetical protein SeMB42_g03269 [Synchytrium endobioticum]|uniref:Uncharacterized protein n=1 Tax=Synchytrium endobioticum TaxID=286115 RepID=A0A507D0Y0_9FUNG|nr:hypothetical protein SeLEV6574_g04098 [Synchytrium endobioticum]TPX47594.1 hypothetical protein SeMB42_g03269 [Synchytrium endobioticum]